MHNTEETIAALAAELERLGKMPEWVDTKTALYPDKDELFFEFGAFLSSEKRRPVMLSALSGVAAEVCARNGFYFIYNGKKWRGYETSGCFFRGSKQFEAYHEALIAALKQIEVKQ